ncbi:MAG: hypothetical protein M5U12_22130, partial [Verrucomicrobia bacterium]|nr:hypothetical protein [Verrucomicrobiota bacterium]
SPRVQRPRLPTPDFVPSARRSRTDGSGWCGSATEERPTHCSPAACLAEGKGVDYVADFAFPAAPQSGAYKPLLVEMGAATNFAWEVWVDGGETSLWFLQSAGSRFANFSLQPARVHRRLGQPRIALGEQPVVQRLGRAGRHPRRRRHSHRGGALVAGWHPPGPRGPT